MIPQYWRGDPRHRHNLVTGDFANAHVPEGYVDRRRAALGVQFIAPDVTANLSLHQDAGSLSRLGASADVTWSPGDHLSFAIAADYISLDTPLRALLHGITANAATARSTYVWDETRSVTLAVSYLSFTDRNQRLVFDGKFNQRLVEIPHFSLTGYTELYQSNNSIAGAPYYNPSADASGTIGLLAEHTLWRHYDRSLVQALTLEGGVYGERRFKGGPIGTVAYEHRWSFNPTTEFRYGVSLGERIYDGKGTRVFGANISIVQHL